MPPFGAQTLLLCVWNHNLIQNIERAYRRSGFPSFGGFIICLLAFFSAAIRATDRLMRLSNIWFPMSGKHDLPGTGIRRVRETVLFFPVSPCSHEVFQATRACSSLPIVTDQSWRHIPARAIGLLHSARHLSCRCGISKPFPNRCQFPRSGLTRLTWKGNLHGAIQTGQAQA
jgi:hypothetical protein